MTRRAPLYNIIKALSRDLKLINIEDIPRLDSYKLEVKDCFSVVFTTRDSDQLLMISELAALPESTSKVDVLRLLSLNSPNQANPVSVITVDQRLEMLCLWTAIPFAECTAEATERNFHTHSERCDYLLDQLGTFTSRPGRDT